MVARVPEKQTQSQTHFSKPMQQKLLALGYVILLNAHAAAPTVLLTGTCCTWGVIVCTDGLPDVVKRGEVVVSPWTCV